LRRAALAGRTVLTVVAAVGLSAAVLAPPASAAHRVDRASVNPVVAADGSLPVIHGKVRDSRHFNIDLASVPAGRYRMVVKDTTSGHNFHFTGPGGVNETTTVSGIGRYVWKVTLERGTYKAVCDPHSSFMNDTLQVT
jgi:hypothetical protein